MRKLTIGLAVILAAVVLTAGAVAAQGNSTMGGHDNAPEKGTAAEWDDWMEQHMTEQMGADAAAQMQDRMGMSYEQMGSMMNDGGMSNMMNGAGSGMGCH